MSTLLIKCTVCGLTIAEVSKVSFSQEDINSYSGCSCEIDGSSHIQVTLDDDIVSFIFPSIDPVLEVSDAIENARHFGNFLIDQFSAENVLLGFTTEQLDTTLATLSSVLDALKSGALNIAIERLNLIVPDGIIITQDRINQYKNYINAYLEE